MSSLRYDEARSLIRSGDLLAWSKNDFAAKAIRRWTGETYEHVALAWVIGSRVFVIESTAWHGVRLRALSEAAPFDWFQTDAPWTEAAQVKALSMLGKPYAWSNIVRLALGLTPTSDPVCSIFCGEVLIADGFPIVLAGLTPGHLIGGFLDAGAAHRRVLP